MSINSISIVHNGEDVVVDGATVHSTKTKRRASIGDSIRSTSSLNSDSVGLSTACNVCPWDDDLDDDASCYFSVASGRTSILSGDLNLSHRDDDTCHDDASIRSVDTGVDSGYFTVRYSSPSVVNMEDTWHSEEETCDHDDDMVDVPLDDDYQHNWVANTSDSSLFDQVGGFITSTMKINPLTYLRW